MLRPVGGIGDTGDDGTGKLRASVLARATELSLAAVVVLSLLDAVATVAWVSAGLATEANPILAPLLHASPLLFVLAKTAVVSLGACTLSYLAWQRPRTVVVASVALALAYTILACWHVAGIALVK